jgi:polyphenol oxidase
MELLRPTWAAPANVGAAMSTRLGGASRGAWASANLGVAVGDSAQAVAQNRQLWAQALGARPVWLRQVHGTTVLHLPANAPDTPDAPADAAWTTERGIACTVQAADCLPVLFSTLDGRAVAAAHAGWRGLAAGVIEATLQALRHGAGAEPPEVVAWLGPCIGPSQFEVGADVLQAFGHDPAGPDPRFFTPRSRPDGSPRWLAHLHALARQRLQAAGVLQVGADPACTVEEASRYFSFRRDGVTGRMAAAVWRR